MHLFSQLHLETSLKRIWHEVFLGRQMIFYYMDGTETSSCLLQITQLICFTFNKSAESDRPHDKVFHGTTSTQIHSHYMEYK